MRSFNDLFENVTHHFEIASPHQRLEIESTLKVENLPLKLTDTDKSATMDDYKDANTNERIWPFLQPTFYVASDPEIWKRAVDLTCETKSVLEKAFEIMAWLHSNLSYDQDSTRVSSRIAEVYELRSGVCQDYTHLMLGFCRSIGIPARYASGYLYNGASDTLVGAQASHAWVEIHLPESGWIGLDPTNNTLADERFIKVAVGRDYDDVAPIKGQYSGTSSCRMEVDVAVSHL